MARHRNTICGIFVWILGFSVQAGAMPCQLQMIRGTGEDEQAQVREAFRSGRPLIVASIAPGVEPNSKFLSQILSYAATTGGKLVVFPRRYVAESAQLLGEYGQVSATVLNSHSVHILTDFIELNDRLILSNSDQSLDLKPGQAVVVASPRVARKKKILRGKNWAESGHSLGGVYVEEVESHDTVWSSGSLSGPPTYSTRSRIATADREVYQLGAILIERDESSENGFRVRAIRPKSSNIK